MCDLVNGIPPRKINDTIMFLAIISSISKVRDKCDGVNSDLQEQFKADLGRWQMPFVSNDLELKAFRDAVYDIWGVKLDDRPATNMPHSETLFKLETMIRSILRDSAPFLNSTEIRDPDAASLLHSQQRERVRNQDISMCPMINDAADLDYDALYPENTWGHCIQPKPSEEPHRSLETSIPTSPTSTSDSLNPIVALLMAGAIFGILIAFFISRLVQLCRRPKQY